MGEISLLAMKQNRSFAVLMFFVILGEGTALSYATHVAGADLTQSETLAF